MAKNKTRYVCGECGYQSPKWMGQCPSCGTWESMAEARAEKTASKAPVAKVYRYAEIQPELFNRFSSGLTELDRVLGGGFVPGSLLLVGGDPGIGKSTLMLQVADFLQGSGQSVAYVSGEESRAQIKLRGERLGVGAGDLSLLTENCFESLAPLLDSGRFSTVFIDSIQTMFSQDVPSGAGSISQVREVTNRLMQYAKTKGVTIVLIGHITKDGALAGPKTLEHMVDGVFYFEGDKYHRLRLIRAQKNRFGPAQELGIFQMEEKGLVEVPNPSQVLLEQRPEATAGSVIVPCIEGTRPLIVEIQVLLSTSTYASPRRVSMGIDTHRLALIMAVLEKKAGLQLQGLDVFVNVVGGLTLGEPAADLGLALAIYSSFRNLSLRQDVAVFGELGLAGEVRSVNLPDMRLKECNNLGFRRIICPKANTNHNLDGIETVGITNIAEALEAAL